MNREVLKPCPFCGGEAELCILGKLMGCCKIRCTKCGIEAQYSYVGNGVKSWNTRQPDNRIKEAFDHINASLGILSHEMSYTDSIDKEEVVKELQILKSILQRDEV